MIIVILYQDFWEFGINLAGWTGSRRHFLLANDFFFFQKNHSFLLFGEPNRLMAGEAVHGVCTGARRTGSYNKSDLTHQINFIKGTVKFLTECPPI